MKIYNTQKEVEADIVNGVLTIDDNVTFNCDIDINADINAMSIKAQNIRALDINALDINANHISYYALCTAYDSITCTSWEAKRCNAHPPICLDGKLTIKEKEVQEVTMEEVCKKFGREVKIKK